VTEARRGSDFFSEQGLLASVRRHSGHPRALVKGLVADVENFQVGPASDDVAVLALRVPPA
jgi:serine phosphatase RsbU (regulator of sigma subunit)